MGDSLDKIVREEQHGLFDPRLLAYLAVYEVKDVQPRMEPTTQLWHCQMVPLSRLGYTAVSSSQHYSPR